VRSKLGLALIAAPILYGCGSSSLSTTQLRSQATGICAGTQALTAGIPAPATPAAGASFLKRGIRELEPELARLQRLHAPSDLAATYGSSLQAFSQELRVLRTTVRNLDSGADPVIAIKTLEQQLAPIEAQANSAWRTLQIPACASQ
jgi:hypothetical protein